MQLVSGGASQRLTEKIGAELGVEPLRRELSRFPDGEIHVELSGDVRDEDVYLVQSTGPPVQEHLAELILLADAAYRAGAARLNAVIPYLAYARQDRRTAPGEPVALRVVADLLSASHVHRIVVVDPHTPDVESIFSVPVETTTAVPDLAEALAAALDGPAVLVAPDLGAAKLAEVYAAHLGLEVAIVRKTRVSGDEVQTTGLIGDVTGRTPVVIDDIVATGGTIASAVRVLLDAGASAPVMVAATHCLLVGPAEERLSQVPIGRLWTTDSLVVEPRELTVEVISLAGRLAEVVRRLHAGEPLAELALHR
ncbi:MAG TPA: ribose-phosphate pyrophosphokinase [Nitriliruptorales bacterium]|nr:ribose-phosphate pyrophosphokinase [Nitriliruptorales bacterium]